jgi:antitoxin (DNA-binding transcriptional repressor) of toxin-antitoxin stability system
MVNASGRDPHNHGRDVVDGAARGEQTTLTGSGKTVAESGRTVAELGAVPRTPLSAEALLTNWRPLPALDPNAPRADLDGLLDACV